MTLLSICIFLSTSIFFRKVRPDASGFFFGSEAQLSKVTRSLLSNLNNCQLKMYYWPDPIQVELDKSLETIRSLGLHRQSYINVFTIHNIVHIGMLGSPSINQDSKLWRLIKYSFRQRSKCSAHIFFLRDFPLQLHLESESWSTKPDYVIAFFTIPPSHRLLMYMFHLKLSQSHYTFARCFAVLNWGKVFAICPSCRQSILREIIELDDIPAESHRYFESMNFKQMFINSDLGDSEQEDIRGTCDLNPGIYGVDRRPPTVEVCVVDTISKVYNFSYYPKRIDGDDRWAYARIKRRQTLSMPYLVEIMAQQRQIVHIGLVFDQWSYLVVKEKVGAFKNVLSGPFGLYIWLGMFFSFAAMTSLHICTMKYQKIPVKLTLERIGKIVEALLSSFLDQHDESPISKLRLSRSSGLISQGNWMLWVFAMVILSIIYKGEIFSNLTRTRDPSSPTSLEGLALSNLDIYTFQFALRQNGKAEVVSQIEDIMETGQYPAYYPALHRSLVYWSYWLFGMRRFTAKLFLQYNPHLLENATDFGIQSEFAVIDMKKHVHMHRYLMSLYTPKKWLSPIHQADMRMSCMPWTVDTNYFLPVFTRGLGAIFEAGLYSRWDIYHDDVNGLNNFYRVQWYLKEEKVKEDLLKNLELNVPKNNWYNYYFYLRRLQRYKDSGVGQASSVPFQVYLTFITLAGGIVTFALFMFIAEYACNFLQRWRSSKIT